MSIFAGNWDAMIARFARGNIDGDLTEQRDAQPLRFTFAAAASENIVAFAVRWREEITHVLDETEHRDIDLVEHGSGLARIDKRNFLRCGDNDGSGKRDRLHNGKLDVAGAGRKIKNQIIELTPFDLLEKLLGVARDHRPAQNRW